jgi:uncharacterized protein with HEPN domain
MKPEDRVRLQHMLDSAQEAVSFATGLGPSELAGNRLVSLAVVRAIEVVGEAASQVSKECRDAHADIPWTKIVGMRNRIVHAYFDIDYGIVSATVRADLPPLVEQLRVILGQPQ